MADRERHSALAQHYERGSFGATGPNGPALALSERRGLAMAQVNGAPVESAPATLGSVTEGDTTPAVDGPRPMVRGIRVAGRRRGLLTELEERLSSTDATVSDLSHARTVLRVGGAAWKDLLAKGCPADIDAMVPGDCVASLLSHFTVVIHCVAEDSADVYVFRSFGASLWEWLRGGAEEFGYTVE